MAGRPHGGMGCGIVANGGSCVLAGVNNHLNNSAGQSSYHRLERLAENPFSADRGPSSSVPGGARLHDYCLLAGGQRAGRR